MDHLEHQRMRPDTGLGHGAGYAGLGDKSGHGAGAWGGFQGQVAGTETWGGFDGQVGGWDWYMGCNLGTRDWDTGLVTWRGYWLISGRKADRLECACVHLSMSLRACFSASACRHV